MIRRGKKLGALQSILEKKSKQMLGLPLQTIMRNHMRKEH